MIICPDYTFTRRVRQITDIRKKEFEEWQSLLSWRKSVNIVFKYIDDAISLSDEVVKELEKLTNKTLTCVIIQGRMLKIQEVEDDEKDK